MGAYLNDHPHLDSLPSRHSRRLYEAGGSAELDRHYRVMAGTTPMQGDPGTWLVMVSLGAVAGEDNRILLTEAGRICAQLELAARTREAS